MLTIGFVNFNFVKYIVIPVTLVFWSVAISSDIVESKKRPIVFLYDFFIVIPIGIIFEFSVSWASLIYSFKRKQKWYKVSRD